MCGRPLNDFCSICYKNNRIFVKKFKKTIDTSLQRWYNGYTSASRLFYCATVCAMAERHCCALLGEGGTQIVTFREDDTVKYFENGGAEKMANDARVKITLVCTECKQRNYDTKKNKKNDPDRIELNKYCKFCRKHTLHKESK